MISRDADYAIRLVLHLAQRGKDTRRRIAARASIPEGCMPRVTRALRAADVITTIPGRGGGLELRHPADQISLLDVVAATDGLLPLNRCLIVPSECSLVHTCQVHPYWRAVQDRLLEDLRAISFAQIASGSPAPGLRAASRSAPRAGTRSSARAGARSSASAGAQPARRAPGAGPRETGLAQEARARGRRPRKMAPPSRPPRRHAR